VGETVTFEDDEDYYVGADTSALDTDVATVEITGTVTKSVNGADRAVSSIESGSKYIIVNTRAGKPMTNTVATSAAAAGAGSGLSLNGVKENVPENAIWTIESANGGYKVTDANGKYLTVTANGASVTDAESIVSISRNGNSWTISQNGAYLNDFGGGGTCAAGWQNAAAANDAGSQWSIYTIKEVPTEGTSVITFTGVAAGQTQVQIGYVMYNITVTSGEQPVCEHKNTETRNAKDATCTEAGYTGDIYCCDCQVKIADGKTIDALGHKFVNGDCENCDEVLTSKFEDVKAGVFYFDPVEWAVEKGITTGVSATIFNPDGKCTRAEVVTFLWRAAGSPDPTTTENPFDDVKEADFFYKAVLWANENNITNGLSKTTFGPLVECNRAQVVTFLWRAQKSPASTATVTFTDVKADQFYSTAVAWAVEKNITNGISATEFGAGNPCNRAQVVTFLYRTFQ
jgi:hypothetical protein